MDDEALKSLLNTAQTVAVVGLSTGPEKPSVAVAKVLIDAGYDVIPVHPHATEILGRKAYATLADIPVPVDIVDVFRPAREAPDLARQAAEIGAGTLWLQLGITSDEARATAEGAGLRFVEDTCIGETTLRLGNTARDARSDDKVSLTDDDLELLRRPLYGFLSVAAGPVPAQPRPVWFEVTTDGTIELFTGPGTLKVRRLHNDPRASLVVAAPVGERERWVSVSGSVTVEHEGAHDLAGRLAARYWDLMDPVRAAQLAEILAEDQVRLVIHPDSVSRFAY